jgi:hypothetical protein
MVQIRRTGADDTFADRKCDLTKSEMSSPACQAYQTLHVGFVLEPAIAGRISFPHIGDLGHVSHLSDCAVIAHRRGGPDAGCRSD